MQRSLSPNRPANLRHHLLAGNQFYRSGSNFFAPAHRLGYPQLADLVWLRIREALDKLVRQLGARLNGKPQSLSGDFIEREGHKRVPIWVIGPFQSGT
jgi:hypothetical protein